MSNLQKISAVGAGTAIFLGNTISANAENLPELEGDTPKRISLQPNRLKVTFSMASLPELSQTSIANPTQFLTASTWNFLPLQSKLAQLSPISPEDRPGEEQTLPSVLRLDVFSNSADPLLLPTQPNEVTIDFEQLVTLEDAVSIAVTNNQEIEISRLTINRSLAELQEARAGLYPSLNSSVGFDNRLTAGAGAGAGIGAPEELTVDNSATNTFDSSLSLSYDVYDGGARGASINSAEKQVRLNQLLLEQTIEDTSLQVATDYYVLQGAEAQVEIEQATVEDAAQTFKDADLLERAGVGTEYEVLQAKVALAQARQTLNLEQANRDIARRQLADTLNVGQKVALQTADEIEPAGTWESSLPESIVMAYDNRAELKQFLLEREINGEQRQIALAANRPQVSLVASYDLQEELDDGSDLADGYSLGATVNWAFFDGGAARAIARQSSTDIEIDEAEFANQRDTIRFEVENAYLSLNANQENIDTAEQAVELAQESLRLARLRFQAGVGTQTDVIVAQTELSTARGNLLSAIIDYNQSFAELERAISDLSDGDPADLS
ncbi:MAG TPA: TolC family protein [Coleofasciculaceae cyanobacterium]|jgi:outer membrane protein TolC